MPIGYRNGTPTFAIFRGDWRGTTLRARRTSSSRSSTRPFPPDSGFGGRNRAGNVLRDLQAAVMILVGAKEQLVSDFALSAHEQQLEQDCASSHPHAGEGGIKNMNTMNTRSSQASGVTKLLKRYVPS